MSATTEDFYQTATMFSPGPPTTTVAVGSNPTTPERVQRFLDAAERRVARDLWGDKGDDGVLYLAAHLLAEDVIANSVQLVDVTGPAGGYAGVITSESLGPISRSYGAKAGSSFTDAAGGNAFADEPLATTVWGKRFVALRREIMAQGVTGDCW